MAERCNKLVLAPGWEAAWGGHRCFRNATVFDQDKWWCTHHPPAKKAERLGQQKERYETQTKALDERFSTEAYDRAAGRYCRARGLTLEALEAATDANPATTEDR